ncbi:CRE-FPN-1.1 protein [Caenorhabditis remanei]|uniref:Solute carrier family 40 member n=1 Tax=Caenorhabditis remanei TaxID=31234 RepID=E3LY19_CAERE|nr:CRE-FPN-1.1 protein [Caenorhabditis remanei]
MVSMTKKELQLNGAFLMTTLGDRMWTFVIGLFMHQLGGMTWVAVQQLVDSVLKLSVITVLGHYLDRVNRDKIIQTTLLINNAAVAGSALIFACLFAYQPDTGATVFLLAAAAIASVSKVASELQRICFTKDWVVVIARSEQIELSRVNSYLLCIDQVSSAILPTISGKLLDSFHWSFVCIFIICYNFVSWAVESYILSQLYKETEALRTRAIENAANEELAGLQIERGSIGMYFKQTSWMAGFGLALLYMTVLGFDNLAASYGQKHGLSAAYIGFLRGFGSLLGILGAFSFQFVARRIGLLWTVMVGLLWQNFFINMCGVSVLLPGSSMNISGFFSEMTVSEWFSQVIQKVANPESQDVPSVPFYDVTISVNLFFMGISLARFGLWLADPAITQIQQETIPENQRYMVFAVQTGLCELFSILKDIIVIFFPFTSLFGALTLGSCVFVFAGFLFNLFYHAQVILFYSCIDLNQKICGFSFTDKNRHLHELQAPDIPLETIPERQSLIGAENGHVVEELPTKNGTSSIVENGHPKENGKPSNTVENGHVVEELPTKNGTSSIVENGHPKENGKPSNTVENGHVVEELPTKNGISSIVENGHPKENGKPSNTVENGHSKENGEPTSETSPDKISQEEQTSSNAE